MATNISHLVQLVLPLTQFVATLSRRLSWSDFVNLLTLKRLNKHERQPGEEAPIGLILCAEPRRAQVALLQMYKDVITVAESWAELPPKAELEQKLHAALLEARERLARRGGFWGTWMMSDDREASKGLGLTVAALPGVGLMHVNDEPEQEAARVFFVAATWVTQRLVNGVGMGSLENVWPPERFAILKLD